MEKHSQGEVMTLFGLIEEETIGKILFRTGMTQYSIDKADIIFLSDTRRRFREGR